MSGNKMQKRCISCGFVFSGEEIEQHMEENDCPSVAMVITQR